MNTYKLQGWPRKQFASVCWLILNFFEVIDILFINMFFLPAEKGLLV